MKKTTLFKHLVHDPAILILPGAHDALSARVIAGVGFKALAVGGYAVSASYLGRPDVGLLTLSEMVDHIARVADATDLPVLADGDTGHGNVTNVMRTVKEIERSGAAAMFLEDQLFPKRCGHMDGKAVIPAPEMIAKIKAAVDARTDQDFTIMARTDALAPCGIDEAIERANRYVEAGADMIFVEAPRTVGDMRRITGEVNSATMANHVEGGKTPTLSARELEAVGYKVVAFPTAAIYAISKALLEVMKEIFENGTSAGFRDRMMEFEEFNRFIGLPLIRETERKYYEESISTSPSQGSSHGG
jgi:2,3-dimethylmalate lyase